MRGRHSAAILTMMGLERGIAGSADAYVALAVALADPGDRAAMRQAVQARKHLLFGDRAPLRALETFLAEEVAARCGVKVLEEA